MKLITDASLTFHGLWGCIFWLQWGHSVHTDQPAAFCTHKKVISQSPLYLRPEA